MAVKPSIALSRWADQVGANLVSPTSGLRDTGFIAGTPAVAGIVNTELNQLYQWALYLSDGVLSGKLTVGGESLSFTDFTFTADSTTDQLAATGNPLQTGDGPVRTSNSGGGLPGGLAAATDYYWIFVDADHGKLATSRANAIAGTAIDITTNGTGTQTLQHQAGTTRIEDAEVTRNLTVDGNLTVSGGLVVSGSIDNGTETVPLVVAGPGTTGTIDVSIGTDWSTDIIGVRIGRKISAIRIWLRDSVTGPTKLRVTLLTASPGGVPSSFAFSGLSAGDGSLQVVTLTLVTPPKTVSGTIYRAGVHYDSGSAGCHVYHAEVDHIPG